MTARIDTLRKAPKDHARELRELRRKIEALRQTSEFTVAGFSNGALKAAAKFNGLKPARFKSRLSTARVEAIKRAVAIVFGLK